jgi:phage terminase large subunit-like protein
MENRQPELLKLRAYYDANPPRRNHWLYKVFIQKLNFETRMPLSKPENYAATQLNPIDNLANLSPEYMDELNELPARMRKRFRDGEFADDAENALFPEEFIDRWRVKRDDVPPLARVVVAVDPSGSGDVNNQDNDAIGIVVVGLAIDGNAYVLQDCTLKAGPATWGRAATDAFERHDADIIVGETNYGGAMVEQTIKVARPRTPFKQVHSSRGKVLRAEPFSAMFEIGKVRLVGIYPELEDELSAFSTGGYMGNRSPNRADALVFALAELFPAMTRVPSKKIVMKGF